jgi:hypothetical protein
MGPISHEGRRDSGTGSEPDRTSALPVRGLRCDLQREHYADGSQPILFYGVLISTLVSAFLEVTIHRLWSVFGDDHRLFI